MRPARTARQSTVAILALVAILLSGISLGLHARGDVVGQETLEPTTVYFSDHARGTGEEHLHAETGFESVLCLACFLSLRDQSMLTISPGLFALSDLRGGLLPDFSSSPLDSPGRASSARAPPLA
jgi:hypothetical protein